MFGPGNLQKTMKILGIWSHNNLQVVLKTKVIDESTANRRSIYLVMRSCR